MGKAVFMRALNRIHRLYSHHRKQKHALPIRSKRPTLLFGKSVLQSNIPARVAKPEHGHCNSCNSRSFGAQYARAERHRQCTRSLGLFGFGRVYAALPA